jgi:hypothetical protein
MRQARLGHLKEDVAPHAGIKIRRKQLCESGTGEPMCKSSNIPLYYAEGRYPRDDYLYKITLLDGGADRNPRDYETLSEYFEPWSHGVELHDATIDINMPSMEIHLIGKRASFNYVQDDNTLLPSRPNNLIAITSDLMTVFFLSKGKLYRIDFNPKYVKCTMYK